MNSNLPNSISPSSNAAIKRRTISSVKEWSLPTRPHTGANIIPTRVCDHSKEMPTNNFRNSEVSK